MRTSIKGISQVSVIPKVRDISKFSDMNIIKICIFFIHFSWFSITSE